jgi:uncharacterized membrane protein
LPSDIRSIAESRYERVLLPAVLILAAVLRVVPAIRRPLQVDEAYSLHVAALPLAQALQAVAALDVHPPVFIILVHFFSSLHAPELAFRLGAAIMGTITVGLFYGAVRAWHSTGVALTAAGLAAAMPSLVFYDTMIRMYPLFDLLAMGTFFVLSILYTRKDLRAASRRTLWCLWAAGCAAMLWTLYLGFLVVVAQLLFAAIMRRDGLVRSIAGAAFAGAAWLPQLGTFLNQLPRGGLAFPMYAGHELAAAFELPGQATIAVQTHGAGGVVTVASVIAWVWVAGALAWGIVAGVRSLAVWLAAPGCLTFAYGLIGHKLLYTDRYYLLAAYALCVLTALALARAWPARRMLALAAGAVVALLVGVLGCAYAFDDRLYTADWPALAAVLQERMQPRDLIVMEQGSSYFPLERGTVLDHHPLILVFRPEDVAGATRLARAFPRVWLVLFQTGPVDPRMALASGVNQGRRLGGVWEFLRALPAENASLILFERPVRRDVRER